MLKLCEVILLHNKMASLFCAKVYRLFGSGIFPIDAMELKDENVDFLKIFV